MSGENSIILLERHTQQVVQKNCIELFGPCAYRTVARVTRPTSWYRIGLYRSHRSESSKSNVGPR